MSFATISMLAVACTPGAPARSLLGAPNFNPGDQTKCHASASASQPLIIEWPSAARGDLEALIEDHKSVAVVRYEGCTMTVLTACAASGKIAYVPFRNTKQDQLRITTADDLYANLPVGAAKLEGTLARSGELDVDMLLVGKYEADTGSVTLADLKGNCDGATHIIRSATVGAFDFHTGAHAAVSGGVQVLGAGAGGGSAARQESLARDGKVDACNGAKVDDADAPPNCGAIVRVEVLALGKPPPPSCADGWQWNGQQCVRTQVQTVTRVDPPPSARMLASTSSATALASTSLAPSSMPKTSASNARFVVEGATVRDRVTNAVWLRSRSPNLRWHEAERYCPAQNEAGGGWRMATKDELVSLTYLDDGHPRVDNQAFPDISDGKTDWETDWSSTPFMGDSARAIVEFPDGRVGGGAVMLDGNQFPVRCVR